MEPTMLASFARHGTRLSRMAFPTVAVVLIGLLVGSGCALLPAGVPLGIVAMPALFLLWVMPDLRIVPERWTRSLLIPFIVSILCVPVYYAIVLPGLPWISIRRAVLFPFIIPLCVILAGSSASREFLWVRLRSARLVWACFVGFTFMVCLSTVLSIRPGQTIGSDVFFITTCFLPMLATILLVRSDGDVIVIFRVAILCIGFDLLIGTIEHVLGHPFLIYLLPAYMRDQIIQTNPLAAVAFISGQNLRGGMYRAASTFSLSLTWGEASAMLAPMCLHFVAHGRSRLESGYGAVGIMMCFMSVFFSGSRGAYVGMIAAAIVYSTIWALRSCRVHPGNLAGKIWLLLYMMASSATLLAVVFVGRVHKLVLGGGEVQSSTEARFMEWALAKPKILARPLWGYGGGMANDVIAYSFAPGGPTTVDGYYMNMLVDYGIPGCIFFFGLFLIAAFLCLRTYLLTDNRESLWGAAVGTSLIAFVIYRTTLSQADNLGLAFVLVGLAFVYQSMNKHILGTRQAGAVGRKSSHLRSNHVVNGVLELS